MPTMQEIVRLITIRGRTEGVTQSEAEVKGLAGAHDNLGKSSISVAGKLDALQKSVDADYRAEEKLLSIEKTLTAARNQGLISIERQNELMTMAAAKYKVAGESAARAAEGMKLLKEVSLGFIGGIGAGVLIGSLTELPTAIAEAVDKLGNVANVAQTIGLTTKALQELRYAAKLSDVDVGTLDTAMQKFSTNLAKNGGPLQKVFEINYQKFSGNVLKDLETYADLIKNASNQEERNQVVGLAFGKSAQEMGRLFDDGSAGIAKWADEAVRAGAVFDDADVQHARAMNDQLEALKPRIEAVQTKFALLVAPAQITGLDLLNQGLEHMAEYTGNISRNIGPMMQFLGSTGFKIGGVGWNALGGPIGGLQGPPLANRSGGPDDRGSKPLVFTVHGGSVEHTKLPSTPDPTAAARQKAIDSVTASLKLQTKALTETDRQAYIDQQLSQAKVTAASKEGGAIEKLAANYYDQKKAIDATNEAASFLAQTTYDAFSNILDGSKDVVHSMLDVAAAIAKAVLQAELLGNGPLADVLGTSPDKSGDAGGILGTVMKALLSGIGGGATGGSTPLHLGYNLNAAGGVYASAGLHAYANTVVSQPTVFPFANGGVPRQGLMGEAGPEAIMPLRRGADGKLGIAAGGGGGVTVNFHNVSKADVPDLDRWASQRLPGLMKRANRHGARATI